MARNRRMVSKSGAATRSFVSSTIRGIERVQDTYTTAQKVATVVKAIATAAGL